MKGKTIAITGSTTGTGYVLAREAAKKGARVLMLNRPSERAKAALDRLTPPKDEAVAGQEWHGKPIEAAVNDYGVVEHIDCDLMSLGSCARAADQIMMKLSTFDEHDHRYPGAAGLDVLACNAGVMHLKDEVTEDGYDVQMQTNQLGHFMLVCKLWVALKAAGNTRGEARVVMHSSAARYFDGHGSAFMYPTRWCTKLQKKYFVKHEAGELGGEGWPVPGKALLFHGPKESRYQQSKLANFVFAYALDDKIKELEGCKVKALVCHPGICKTQLIQGPKNAGYEGIAVGEMMFTPVMMSVDDGAQSIVRCSLAAGVASGDFYGPGWPMWPFTFWGASVKQEPDPWLLADQQKKDVVEWCQEAIGEKFDDAIN